MYDIFVNYLSPELLSQAEYINGTLYLPVYALVSEIASMIVPVFCALVLVSGVLLAVENILMAIFRIFRRLKYKCMGGIFHV